MTGNTNRNKVLFKMLRGTTTHSSAKAHRGFEGIGYQSLTQKWTVNPNSLVYTFTLAPNAKFREGAPVTAADVKFTLLDREQRRRVYMELQRLLSQDLAARLYRSARYGVVSSFSQPPDERGRSA